VQGAVSPWASWFNRMRPVFCTALSWCILIQTCTNLLENGLVSVTIPSSKHEQWQDLWRSAATVSCASLFLLLCLGMRCVPADNLPDPIYSLDRWSLPVGRRILRILLIGVSFHMHLATGSMAFELDQAGYR